MNPRRGDKEGILNTEGEQEDQRRGGKHFQTKK